MKNRYCLFCGTLLPEDGVCLRCGAKYELADDGQMKVIPRKVKKVSVKPSVKKKTTAKKAEVERWWRRLYLCYNQGQWRAQSIYLP